MPAVSRVLVAGGGIGGLALAIALRRNDIEPVVIERTTEYADAGAGMVLSPNGVAGPFGAAPTGVERCRERVRRTC